MHDQAKELKRLRTANKLQEATIRKLNAEVAELKGDIKDVLGDYFACASDLHKTEHKLAFLQAAVDDLRAQCVKQIKCLLQASCEYWKEGNKELAVVNDEKARFLWQYMPSPNWHEFAAEFKAIRVAQDEQLRRTKK